MWRVEEQGHLYGLYDIKVVLTRLEFFQVRVAQGQDFEHMTECLFRVWVAHIMLKRKTHSWDQFHLMVVVQDKYD